jgi:hypothetical protein
VTRQLLSLSLSLSLSIVDLSFLYWTFTPPNDFFFAFARPEETIKPKSRYSNLIFCSALQLVDALQMPFRMNEHQVDRASLIPLHLSLPLHHLHVLIESRSCLFFARKGPLNEPKQNSSTVFFCLLIKPNSPTIIPDVLSTMYLSVILPPNSRSLPASLSSLCVCVCLNLLLSTR